MATILEAAFELAASTGFERTRTPKGTAATIPVPACKNSLRLIESMPILLFILTQLLSAISHILAAALSCRRDGLFPGKPAPPECRVDWYFYFFGDYGIEKIFLQQDTDTRTFLRSQTGQSYSALFSIPNLPVN